MYFSFIPDIKYDEKPMKLPFSQAQYVTAKNFFRRFKVDEDYFQYSVYFNKYAVTDSDRLDTISDKFYKDPNFDWVIALTNNILNVHFDWPLKDWEVREMTINPDDVHHYETIETKNSLDEIVLEGGIIVDETFYNSPIYRGQDIIHQGFQYYDDGFIKTVPGNNVSKKVTNLEQALKENDAKREIFVLRPQYLIDFVTEFREKNLYTKSSNYISNTLKKTG